ncbi:MAG TPA: ATP-binding protein [Myxococcota bacterium]|nr:ATP-binding protein [Myxococcota bacterium]
MKFRLFALLDPPLSRLGDSNAAKLGWIVRLRWIALAAQGLSIFPALQFDLLEPARVPLFLGLVAALALLNALTWVRLRRGRDVSQPELGLQLFADIAALSALLGLSGGAWNPLVPLLFFHAGLGALLLEGRVSLSFFWSLVACLAFVQAFGHVPPGLLGTRVSPAVLFPAQFLVAGVFWLFTTWLSHTLAALQAHVHARRQEQGRIDRLRAVGALAAGLSHEFATPLNTAMLKLERLARKLDLAANPALQEASEALARCEEVLRQMAGSQLRPDALQLEVEDVGELVEKVCAGLRAEDPAVPLRFKRERGPALVVVPVVAFTQAVMNLVDNALEESSAETPTEVEVHATPERVSVEVRDRGPGWPEIVRAHLGEPFVTTRPGGVGLGLYFAYTLAETIGGVLELDAAPGGGAIARLVLPPARALAAETRA